MTSSPFKFGFNRTNILSSPTPSLEDRFELGQTLGKGHFGVVRRCRDKQTGEQLACKSINKAKLKRWEERQDVLREVEIMSLLDSHPGMVPSIVSLKSTFEDSDCVHLVMDCCDGGELFDEISNRGPLTEAHSAQAFACIAEALAHCHSLGVLHRDLKPENILLVEKPQRLKKLEVKLADFGLSVRLKAGEAVRGLAGSPYYLAPEVLTGTYGLKADIWSLGVVLYMMLSETAPFYGETETAILESIRAADLQFASSNWEKVSEEAKELVKMLLQKEPQLRPAAAEVLQHPWVVKHTAESSDAENQPRVIARSCSATPAKNENPQCCTLTLSAETVGVQQCQSLTPHANTKASDLLHWLSPQLAGASGEHTAGAGPALKAPLLNQFNEVMAELEDGIHYFVLEESTCSKTGVSDLRLQLAQIEEVDCKPPRQQAAAQVAKPQEYEPTPADALDWIFGL